MTERLPVSGRTPPETRAAYRRFVPITTRWADNDVYGHVNNVVYYAFFDTAVNSVLIAEGALDIAKSAVIGLVVETGCRYFRSMAFPDRVTAGIRVAHLGTSSVRYEVGLFREDEEEETPAYLINRPVLPAELEEELKTCPFESHDLCLGQKNGLFGSTFRKVGRFKGLIRVMLNENDPPLFDLNELLKPKPYKVT